MQKQNTPSLTSYIYYRVHDNSKANAVMQQATVILQVEESMPLLRRLYDSQYISKYCAPLAEAYDDDITTNPRYHNEMGRITSQIKVSEENENFPFWNKNLE